MKLTAMVRHSKLYYLLQPYFLLLFHNYKILTTPNNHVTLTQSKQFLIRSFHNHSYVLYFSTHTFLEHLFLHKYFTSSKLTRSNPDYFHLPSFLFFLTCKHFIRTSFTHTHFTHFKKYKFESLTLYIFFFHYALHHKLHTSQVFFFL